MNIDHIESAHIVQLTHMHLPFSLRLSLLMHNQGLVILFGPMKALLEDIILLAAS